MLPEQSLPNFSLISKNMKVEFAAIVGAGKQFVQATYKLEGDGPLVFQVYEIISALSTSITMENYPNVPAVVKNISRSTEQLRWKNMPDNVLNQHWIIQGTFTG